MTRDDQIDQEARSLWQALREGPPPAGLSGADLLNAALCQADTPKYERLHSPFLRESQISRPGSR